ncbi:MAG: heat-inducible transcriptional repressor HrcA [Myxococcota bacterium]
MPRERVLSPHPKPPIGPGLTERQRQVLRAAVRAYVGEAVPIGSKHLSHLLPTPLSAASIRTTLAELGELGLVEQPHSSAGRVPTQEGLRHFIDHLLDRRPVSDYERRTVDFGVGSAGTEQVVEVAAQLLSQQTRLLGFAVAPRLDRVRLQHVSLVRLGAARILAVLVSTAGDTYRRTLPADSDVSQRELDRAALLLNERVVGRTLPEVRDQLRREAQALRSEADRLLRWAVALGEQAVAPTADEPVDVVVAARLALLDQPEYRDPDRVREIFETLEAKERLAEVVEEMLAGAGVCVALGAEMGDPSLARCALVATHYGEADAPLGAVGVMGPSRMDYSRVIPLVAYCSQRMTEKLQAE